MSSFTSCRATWAAVVLAAACSGAKPAPRPAPVVIASTSPEPEPPPSAEPAATGEIHGELDASFGDAGVGRYERAPDEQRFSQITLLADDSIAAVGYAPFDGSSDIMAAHLMSNGALDQAFGDHGFARVGNTRGFGEAITHDDKGRLLVAGYFYARGSTSLLVARLDARGRLDPSFGKDGIVTRSGEDNRPHAIFVRRDGHVLVLSYHARNQNAALCLQPNGELDTSYGQSGIGALESGAEAFATRGTLAPDGSLVAGGYQPREHRGVVAKLDPRGRPDPRFGRDGVVTVAEPRISSAWALALDGHGRVYLGAQSDARAAVVLRFGPDGQLDPSWGRNGVALVDDHGDDQLYALLFDSHQDLIGVGFRDLAEDAQALVARFDPRGRLDPSFGERGVWHKKLGGGTFFFDAKWDGKGRLVAAGDVWSGTRSRALAARLR